MRHATPARTSLATHRDHHPGDSRFRSSFRTVGTTLDGTLGLVVGDGFQLGLFNEFEPQGTPVPLSQVKAAIGTGGLERAGNDGTGIDVALIDTGVVPVAGLDRGDVVAHGPDLSFDQQAGLAPGLDG